MSDPYRYKNESGGHDLTIQGAYHLRRLPECVGHDVLTLPFSDALQRFNREWDEHLKTCEKASEQP